MLRLIRDGQVWIGYPSSNVIVNQGVLENPEDLYTIQSHTRCWFCNQPFVGYPRWMDNYGRRVCSRACQHLSTVFFMELDRVNDPKNIQNDPTKKIASNPIWHKDRNKSTRPNGSLVKRPMNDSRVTGSNPGTTKSNNKIYNEIQR